MNEQRYSRYRTFIRPLVKNKFVRTYSSLAFSLVAVMIFAVFAIKPTITTILVLEQNINEQRDVADKLKTKAQNLSLGKQNFEKIDQDTIDKINALLPRKTDITSVGESVATVVRSNEASVSAIQFQPTDLNGESNNLSAAPSLHEVSFVLNASGTYESLVASLNSLSNSSRLVRIDSVSMNPIAANQVSMSVSMRAFYLKD